MKKSFIQNQAINQHQNYLTNQKINASRKTKIIWRGFFLRIFILILLGLISIISFLGYKFYQFNKKISAASLKGQISNQTNENRENSNNPNNFTIEEEKSGAALSDIIKNKKRLNILLLGKGGEGHAGRDLTDTIILASINLETYQSALISIPRDLYVDIPGATGKTKINALYAFYLRNKKSAHPYGIWAIKKAVEEITGQDIDYHLMLDFDGFEEIIDELGGIDIEVPDDIYDPRFPGPGYSYQTFKIEKGFQHLDGATALKYARVRHTSGGDFSRASRQQQILAAAQKKILTAETILNPIRLANLLDTLGEHIKTDFPLTQISDLIHLSKNINIYQTTNYVLDAWKKDSLLAVSHVPLGGVNAFVLVPRAKNYSQIKEVAENIFDLEKIKQNQEKIKNENAKILIAINKQEDYYQVKRILSQFGYSKISIQTDENSYCKNEDQNIADFQDQIISFSGKEKIFTLNDLAGKFDSSVNYFKNSETSEERATQKTQGSYYAYKDEKIKTDQQNSADNLNRQQKAENYTENKSIKKPNNKKTNSTNIDIIVCLSDRTLNYFKNQQSENSADYNLENVNSRESSTNNSQEERINSFEEFNEKSILDIIDNSGQVIWGNNF